MSNVHQLAPAAAPESPFDRFWAVYPKQQRIAPARRQWLWALNAADNDHEAIIAGAARFAAYCRREAIEDRFIPMPHVWLQDERWHDVYERAAPPAQDPDDERLKRLASMVKRENEGAFYRDYVRQNVTDQDRMKMRQKGLI